MFLSLLSDVLAIFEADSVTLGIHLAFMSSDATELQNLSHFQPNNLPI